MRLRKIAFPSLMAATVIASLRCMGKGTTTLSPASRDITVPIGTSATLAISLYKTPRCRA